MAYEDIAGKSGVQVRSRHRDKKPSGEGSKMNGPQVDIDSETEWCTGLQWIKYV